MSEKKKMDFKNVQALIDLMKENDLAEVEIVQDGDKIHIKRPGAVQFQAHPSGMPAMLPAVGEGMQPSGHSAPSNLKEIKTPIIGTYYSSPSPDAEPFIKVGDVVSPDTVVCIIEAMKVMNEIKAEISGTVVEVLCKAGQAVEFDEVMFRVKP